MDEKKERKKGKGKERRLCVDEEKKAKSLSFFFFFGCCSFASSSTSPFTLLPMLHFSRKKVESLQIQICVVYVWKQEKKSLKTFVWELFSWFSRGGGNPLFYFVPKTHKKCQTKETVESHSFLQHYLRFPVSGSQILK